MPWSAEPWRLLGEARLAVRRPAPAEAALREALAKDDRDWLTWFDLAAATSGAERRQALARARRLNPRSPEIRGLFR
jgi:Flp pilus assembly protein TadD